MADDAVLMRDLVDIHLQQVEADSYTADAKFAMRMGAALSASSIVFGVLALFAWLRWDNPESALIASNIGLGLCIAGLPMIVDARAYLRRSEVASRGARAKIDYALTQDLPDERPELPASQARPERLVVLGVALGVALAVLGRRGSR